MDGHTHDHAYESGPQGPAGCRSLSQVTSGPVAHPLTVGSPGDPLTKLPGLARRGKSYIFYFPYGTRTPTLGGLPWGHRRCPPQTSVLSGFSGLLREKCTRLPIVPFDRLAVMSWNQTSERQANNAYSEHSTIFSNRPPIMAAAREGSQPGRSSSACRCKRLIPHRVLEDQFNQGLLIADP